MLRQSAELCGSLLNTALCSQNQPLHWEPAGKDQPRTPEPRGEYAGWEDARLNVTYSCSPEMGMQMKKPHSVICMFLHFRCEEQLPSWFYSITKKAQGIAACK